MSDAIKKHLGAYIDQMAEQRVQEALRKEKINNIVDTFKAGLSLNGLAQAFHLPADEIKEILQQHNLSV